MVSLSSSHLFCFMLVCAIFGVCLPSVTAGDAVTDHTAAAAASPDILEHGHNSYLLKSKFHGKSKWHVMKSPEPSPELPPCPVPPTPEPEPDLALEPIHGKGKHIALKGFLFGHLGKGKGITYIAKEKHSKSHIRDWKHHHDQPCQSPRPSPLPPTPSPEPEPSPGPVPPVPSTSPHPHISPNPEPSPGPASVSPIPVTPSPIPVTPSPLPSPNPVIPSPAVPSPTTTSPSPAIDSPTPVSPRPAIPSPTPVSPEPMSPNPTPVTPSPSPEESPIPDPSPDPIPPINPSPRPPSPVQSPSPSPKPKPTPPSPRPRSPSPSPRPISSSPSPRPSPNPRAPCDKSRCAPPNLCEYRPTCTSTITPRNCPPGCRCELVSGTTCVYKFKPASEVCHRADGSCGNDVTCPGTTGFCPAAKNSTLKFKPAGTQCAAAKGDCGTPATCDGTSSKCPLPHSHGDTSFTYRCGEKFYTDSPKKGGFKKDKTGKGWDLGGQAIGEGDETFEVLDAAVTASVESVELLWKDKDHKDKKHKSKCTPGYCPKKEKMYDAVFLVCVCNATDSSCNWKAYDYVGAPPPQAGKGICPTKPFYAQLDP